MKWFSNNNELRLAELESENKELRQELELSQANLSSANSELDDLKHS